MSEQNPSVGRVVHYVSHGTPTRSDGTRAYGQACRAAIVTDAGPGLLPDAGAHDLGEVASDNPVASLCVLNPTGQFFRQGVPFDGGETHDVRPGPGYLCDNLAHESGTWHWPART